MTKSQAAIDRLLAIMAKLRAPEGGCPWDREQTFATIAPYTIEEAYEVSDAIVRGDMNELRDELGDLLFQVVFHARMAEEAGDFDFAAVANAISEKMERRHPHVFGETEIRDAAAQTVAWESHKAAERAARKKDASVLADVPLALPALLRAEKIGKRVARVGFDWPDPTAVMEKVREEIGEIDEAMQTNASAEAVSERVGEEIGDLLFAAAQLARHYQINPESALRDANGRFERRFRFIEKKLAERGRTPAQSTIDEMDALWGEAKKAEKSGAA